MFETITSLHSSPPSVLIKKRANDSIDPGRTALQKQLVAKHKESCDEMSAFGTKRTSRG
jgi:hypothetical protein